MIYTHIVDEDMEQALKRFRLGGIPSRQGEIVAPEPF
jgi:hypothetical protein